MKTTMGALFSLAIFCFGCVAETDPPAADVGDHADEANADEANAEQRRSLLGWFMGASNQIQISCERLDYCNFFATEGERPPFITVRHVISRQIRDAFLPGHDQELLTIDATETENEGRTEWELSFTEKVPVDKCALVLRTAIRVPKPSDTGAQVIQGRIVESGFEDCKE
jgi:hypothetical protein